MNRIPEVRFDADTRRTDGDTILVQADARHDGALAFLVQIEAPELNFLSF
mgnify:CR=1 FL=1